jgi:hypothetical protein
VYGFTQKGWWQNWTGGGAPFAYAWWKPIDMFRFQIGHNPDGDWGGAQITGWGFNSEAQDFVAIDNDSGDFGTVGWKTARSAGFYPGFSNVGITLSLYPIDGLSLNFALPFSGNSHNDGGELTKEVFRKFHVNVRYDLTDIGSLRISFVGLGGTDKELATPAYRSAGTMYASFFMTAIDGMAIDIGASFGLPYKNATDVDIAPGMGIGFGLRYAAGDFGVKLRAGATLGSKQGDAKGDTVIGFVVLPYYNLGALTAFLNAGLGMTVPDSGDSITDWFVNPYIRVPVGGFNFYAGFKLGSDGRTPKAATGDDKVVNWAVPIGVNVYF